MANAVDQSLGIDVRHYRHVSWSPNIVDQDLQEPWSQVIDYQIEGEGIQVCLTGPQDNPVFPALQCGLSQVDLGAGVTWWDIVHLFPPAASLGNVTADQSIEFELYNAFRGATQTVTTVDDNTFGGATIDLTTPVGIFSQTGVLFNLVVSRIGEPTIGGSFTFNIASGNIELEVDGTRIIMLLFPPEGGINEVFAWRTNTLQTLNSTQQRIAARRHARRRLGYTMALKTDKKVQEMEIFMNAWQSNVFGVPIWTSMRSITAAVSAGATAVNITTNADTDLVVGGLCVLIEFDALGEVTGDSLTVASIGSPDTVINFNTSLVNSYTTSAFLVPVLPGVLTESVSMTRQPSGFTKVRGEFTLVENDFTYIPQTTWSTYNSKLVVDTPNVMEGGSRQDNFRANHQRIDYGTGLLQQFTAQLTAVQLAPRGFFIQSPFEYMEVRRLFNELRGGQISFYQPTGLADLTLAADAGIGSSNIDVVNVGYFLYNEANNPKKHIRISLNDGTLMDHEITGSSEISGLVERLTISPATSQAFTVAETARIEFLMLSRFTDEVAFKHTWVDGGAGTAIESNAKTATIGVINA